MSPRVQGMLGAQDHSDTYTLWRKPGPHRYELEVRGAGAADLILEAPRSGNVLDPVGGAWHSIEERHSVRSGRVSGTVVVPEVPVDDSSNLQWVRIRVRIVRAAPGKAVEYDFYLEPGAAGAPREPGPSPSSSSSP